MNHFINENNYEGLTVGETKERILQDELTGEMLGLKGRVEEFRAAFIDYLNDSKTFDIMANVLFTYFDVSEQQVIDYTLGTLQDKATIVATLDNYVSGEEIWSRTRGMLVLLTHSYSNTLDTDFRIATNRLLFITTGLKVHINELANSNFIMPPKPEEECEKSEIDTNVMFG